MIESFLYSVDCLHVLLALIAAAILFTMLGGPGLWMRIGKAILTWVIIVLLTPICIEWPMGTAFWNQENGKWVRHTQPIFHPPFSFTGLREYDFKEKVSLSFNVSGKDPTILFPREVQVTAIRDLKNMETFCATVGPHWWTIIADTETVSFTEKKIIREELESIIKECTKQELLDTEFLSKNLSTRLQVRGFKLVDLVVKST